MISEEEGPTVLVNMSPFSPKNKQDLMDTLMSSETRVVKSPAKAVGESSMTPVRPVTRRRLFTEGKATDTPTVVEPQTSTRQALLRSTRRNPYGALTLNEEQVKHVLNQQQPDVSSAVTPSNRRAKKGATAKKQTQVDEQPTLLDNVTTPVRRSTRSTKTLATVSVTMDVSRDEFVSGQTRRRATARAVRAMSMDPSTLDQPETPRTPMTPTRTRRKTLNVSKDESILDESVTRSTRSVRSQSVAFGEDLGMRSDGLDMTPVRRSHRLVKHP